MGLRRGFVVGFLFCLLAPRAGAEWKASVNADATVEGLYWASGLLKPDHNRARAIGTLKVPASLKNGRAFRLRFLPVLQSDHLSPSKSERFFWDTQEGYMQVQSLPWTFQAGFNVQAWGDTDVFNPLDVVNARRYYDPLRSEKLGAATILAKREWEKFFVEALYIPFQRRSLLPGERSRWLPREVYKTRKFEGSSLGSATLSGVIHLPADMRYQYLEPLELDHALHNNFGGRVKFRFSGFDWTLAGFHGAASTPAVNLDTISVTSTILPGATSVDLDVGPDIYFRALYYKARMLGTSFVWVLGDFLVKGASAHTKVLSKVTGNLLPRDSWENVLGVERTFSLGSGSLTAMAQGTYVARDEKLDTNSISLARMFDRAVMAGLRWTPGERVTVLASLIHDLHYQGEMSHAELSYKLSDGWLAKVSGDLLAGRPETPLGTFRRNDRVILSLNVQK